jgi:hypothetical protein
MASPQAAPGTAAGRETLAGGQSAPAVALAPQAIPAALPAETPAHAGTGARAPFAAPATPPPGGVIFVQKGDVAFVLGGTGGGLQVWAVQRDRGTAGFVSAPPDHRAGRGDGPESAVPGRWDQAAPLPETPQAGPTTGGAVGPWPGPGFATRLSGPGRDDRLADGMAYFGLDEAAFVLALVLAGTEPVRPGAEEKQSAAAAGRCPRGPGR